MTLKNLESVLKIDAYKVIVKRGETVKDTFIVRHDADFDSISEVIPHNQAAGRAKVVSLRIDSDGMPVVTCMFPGVIVETLAGFPVDFDIATTFMDDDVREQVHAAMAPCTEQDFMTAYEHAHQERFGTPWLLSTANPNY